MTTAQNSLRYIFFSVWAVLMTALTYILGAPPLKVVRRKIGRVGYWALMTLLSVGIYFLQAKMLSLAFFSLVVLIGVFDEVGAQKVIQLVAALNENALIKVG